MAAEFQEVPDKADRVRIADLGPKADWGPKADRVRTIDTEVRVPVAENPALRQVITTQQPLAIMDARHDPLTTATREMMVMRNVHSTLIVPLVVKGKVIGTIGLDAIGKPRTFSPEEMDLAQTIANQVAIAIENAQLFAAEACRRRELETLQAATRILGTTLDLQEILQCLRATTRRRRAQDHRRLGLCQARRIPGCEF
jgi:GAF domain-containing protein